MDTLFPMLFTLIAAAIDPKNNTSSGSKFFFIARAQIESIASPAPTLSSDCAAKAGQDTGFESFLKSVAPFFPFVIIKFLILFFLIKILAKIFKSNCSSLSSCLSSASLIIKASTFL